MKRGPIRSSPKYRRAAISSLVFGVILAAVCASAAESGSHRPRVVADASYVYDLIEAPVPDYPKKALQREWSGIGVFEIHFRSDGTAEKVSILLTTGYQVLDDTARAALLRWRCKPRAQREARMAMSFSSGKALIRIQPGAEEEIKKRTFLTRAERPDYPYEARRQGMTGLGVFIIRFADDGSVAKVVALKSTGHTILDDTAMAAFRRWRCRPGAYTIIKVPINYTIESRQR